MRAQLLGRVLGVRLLRVDGTVLLSPARDVNHSERARSPAPGEQIRPVGAELAQAARLLDESEEALRRHRPAIR